MLLLQIATIALAASKNVYGVTVTHCTGLQSMRAVLHCIAIHVCWSVLHCSLCCCNLCVPYCAVICIVMYLCALPLSASLQLGGVLGHAICTAIAVIGELRVHFAD